jgi:uncharacterized protein (DUF305 family)
MDGLESRPIMTKTLWTIFPLILLTACQQPAEAPKAGDKAVAATASYNEAQKAYAAANDKMHSAMGGSIDADADVAFVQGMIPHHEGAVEMAQIALKHGKDPEVRALARQVIAAQEAEIKQMQAWLDARGVKPTAEADANEIDHKAMGH